MEDSSHGKNHYSMSCLISIRQVFLESRRSENVDLLVPLQKLKNLVHHYCAGSDLLDIADLHMVKELSATYRLWDNVDGIHECHG